MNYAKMACDPTVRQVCASAQGRGRACTDPPSFTRVKINAELFDKIRELAKIEDVIGASVALTKRDRTLVGKCPFHSDTRGDFHVNAERGFFYCFGCHAKGDVIGFVQMFERSSVNEAAFVLALRLGLGDIQ